MVILFKGDTFQADIIDMSAHAKENSGFSHILIVINTTSLHGWAVATKNGDGRHIADAMDTVLSERHIPEQIHTELYGGFDSEDFYDLMQRYRIKHCRPYPNRGMQIIERFHDLLVSRIFMHLESFETVKWVDDLDKIVARYNSTRHLSLDELL